MEREIVGASALARRLGCSKRTILRWWDEKRLPARKPGGVTSPLRMTVAEIEAFKKRGA